MLCTNSRIEKNKLHKVDDDAIDVEGDDNQILGNKIKNSGDNGIEMGPADGDPFAVTGNLLQKNNISASGGNGVYIATDSIGVFGSDRKTEQVHVVVGLNDSCTTPRAAIGRQRGSSGDRVGVIIAAITKPIQCAGQDCHVVLEDG